MTAPEFKSALRELGLTQAEFSRRSGVAISTVNRWATGELPVPGWAAWVVRLLRERRDIREKLAS